MIKHIGGVRSGVSAIVSAITMVVSCVGAPDVSARLVAGPFRSNKSANTAKSGQAVDRRPASDMGDAWMTYGRELTAAVEDLASRWLAMHRRYSQRAGVRALGSFGRSCETIVRKGLESVRTARHQMTPERIHEWEAAYGEILQCWDRLLTTTRSLEKQQTPARRTKSRPESPETRDHILQLALLDAERNALHAFRRRVLETLQQRRRQIEACQRQSVDLTLRLFERDQACRKIQETHRTLKRRYERLLHEKTWIEALSRDKDRSLRVCRKRALSCLRLQIAQRRRCEHIKRRAAYLHQQTAQRLNMLEGILTIYKDRLKETVRALHQENRRLQELRERLQSVDTLLDQRLHGIVQESGDHQSRSPRRGSDIGPPSSSHAPLGLSIPFMRSVTATLSHSLANAIQRLQIFSPCSVL